MVMTSMTTTKTKCFFPPRRDHSRCCGVVTHWVGCTGAHQTPRETPFLLHSCELPRCSCRCPLASRLHVPSSSHAFLGQGAAVTRIFPRRSHAVRQWDSSTAPPLPLSRRCGPLEDQPSGTYGAHRNEGATSVCLMISVE